MLTLRIFSAASSLTPPNKSPFCNSNPSFALCFPRSSSIQKQNGDRICFTAVRRQKEAATPVEAELLDEEQVSTADLEGDYSGREGLDYDKDPEFAEILGSCFDDPEKAQARV